MTVAEAFLGPRGNPHLFGHAPAASAMAAAVRSGRMHHAWLISGAPGVGKATLGYRFARWLLAGAPAGDTLALDPRHPVFRRVAAATHADLLTVEREYDDKRKRQRTEIIIDDVREVAQFMRLTPAEGGWRIVLIDGAESLNRNAANALLKILEEPPARAVLLLVCETPGRLLPTIRSRCRLLRLDPLAEPQLEAALAAALPEVDAPSRGRLAALSGGSPGRALMLAEGEGVTLAALVRQVLEAVPAVSAGRAHEVADAVGRSEEGFATFMELLRAGLAGAVAEAARGRAVAWQRRLVEQRPLDAWCEVWQGLGRLQDETERAYLDKRQAIVTGLGLLSGGTR